MISAAEARQKAQEAEKEDLARYWAVIEAAIQTAISNHQTRAWLYFAIPTFMRNVLQNAGYKVTFDNQYNDISTIISWDEAESV